MMLIHFQLLKQAFAGWAVSEWQPKFENALFWKIWCAIFEVFRPAGATHLTDVNKMWQDERDWRSQIDQIWRLVVSRLIANSYWHLRRGD